MRFLRLANHAGHHHEHLNAGHWHFIIRGKRYDIMTDQRRSFLALERYYAQVHQHSYGSDAGVCTEVSLSKTEKATEHTPKQNAAW